MRDKIVLNHILISIYRIRHKLTGVRAAVCESRQHQGELIVYLTAQAIAAMESVKRTHFLNISAVRENKSIGDAAGLKNLGVHLITVQPGHRSTEYHFHHYEEECVYVLSGHGSAVIGDQTHAIGPGDFMGHPIDTIAHEMINDGSEPLVCLVIGQRLTQDITDYPRQGKRLFRHSGARSLVDVDAIKPA
jgi:uncharacterized cupin superfamily protein